MQSRVVCYCLSDARPDYLLTMLTDDGFERHYNKMHCSVLPSKRSFLAFTRFDFPRLLCVQLIRSAETALAGKSFIVENHFQRTLRLLPVWLDLITKDAHKSKATARHETKRVSPLQFD